METFRESLSNQEGQPGQGTMSRLLFCLSINSVARVLSCTINSRKCKSRHTNNTPTESFRWQMPAWGGGAPCCVYFTTVLDSPPAEQSFTSKRSLLVWQLTEWTLVLSSPFDVWPAPCNSSKFLLKSAAGGAKWGGFVWSFAVHLPLKCHFAPRDRVIVVWQPSSELECRYKLCTTRPVRM